jgi:hypothetical protein
MGDRFRIVQTYASRPVQCQIVSLTRDLSQRHGGCISWIDDTRTIVLDTMVFQMVHVYKYFHGRDGVLQTRRDVVANFIGLWTLGRELKLTKVNLTTAHFLQQSQLARHSILAPNNRIFELNISSLEAMQ